VAAAGDAGRASDSVANATHDLYRQYGKQIYAYCLHQLRSREEAEDAVQTTFLNAFRGLQRGTTTRFEQAWLYKIAQNVCIARRSSSGKRLRLESPDDFEILEEVVPSGSSAADSDTLELIGLETALEQMPENQRRAILLREWQGLSYREIAEQLDLSQGAVEMLIFRARRTLALALEQPAAEQRRTGMANTGFSFGSLIAAMKGLFSTGAALKMAAVAVTAAVVSTNAVHSVVHRITTQKHTRAAVAPQVREGSTASLVVPKASVQLVSWKAARAKVVTARGGEPASATSTGPAGSGPMPVIASDASAPAPTAPPAANEPAAPGSGSTGGGVVSPIASAAPVATHPAAETASSNPPPPPPPAPSGSGTSEGSGGQGSGSSGGGGQHHGHGGGNSGGSSRTTSGTGGTGGMGGNDSGGKGAGHNNRGGGKDSSTSDTTTTDPTTTTTSTTTTDQTTTDTTTTIDTTTTPNATTSDSSTSSDASGTTTTTTTQTTTTQTTSDGGGSDGGSSSSGGGGGHDHGHGGGNGGGGGGGHHHGGGG
jgi:RNA polymerase sigma factor (sigma-70 family)